MEKKKSENKWSNCKREWISSIRYTKGFSKTLTPI